MKGRWGATVLMPGDRQYNEIREHAQGRFLPDVMGSRVISGKMETSASAKLEIVSRLLEAGRADTVYRDLYRGGAGLGEGRGAERATRVHYEMTFGMGKRAGSEAGCGESLQRFC
ncbi:MAG: hypothetical protein ACXW4I_04265 [Candidatus Deferrimicrobiaceae bacterium]